MKCNKTRSLASAAFLAGALMAASPASQALQQRGAPACRAEHAPGLSLHTLVSGGRERHYLAYIPRSNDGTRPAPAVIDLHGSGSNPEEELMVNGMASEAEREGFLVLLPVAAVEFPLGGYTWNVPVRPGLPDDVGFVRDVMDDAAVRLCIDQQRVYVTGFSGGARLASQVACQLADRVAALGAVGGLRRPEGCAPARAVPVIAFHGTADPVNPCMGGGPAYWGYGVDAALRAWLERNRCPLQVSPERLAPSVVRYWFRSCDGTADVVFYRLEGAGHVWPGSGFAFPVERFGAMNAEVSATREMVAFFRRQAIP
ncbi:MAG TPA: PHB depolymerase family esterase [Burkholderiales bacterium]|nr:PHB depolymerase family esterase [Burkholderiales bacterium]